MLNSIIETPITLPSLLICLAAAMILGVLTAAVPKAEFSNQFTAQGINQTLHQIMLDITVDVTLLIPGGRAETNVTAQVCVAETLLVGEVPDTYLGLPATGS